MQIDLRKLLIGISGGLILCLQPTLLRADGICDQSGWCRLHYQFAGRPGYTVFIKPFDQYAQFRRFWVQAGDFNDTVTLDCGSRLITSSRDGGIFSPIPYNTLADEMYQSICLQQNQQISFPQQTSPQPWPQQPPMFPGGGMGAPPTQPPLTIDNLLRMIIK